MKHDVSHGQSNMLPFTGCAVIEFSFIPSPTTCINSEVSSELIQIDPSVRHVTEGDSVFLSVKTNFSPDKAEFQGTWCHTGMSSTKPRILVTFTKKNTILSMKHRDHLVFNNSTFSLEIKNLNRKDEGDYHLNINIKHDNKPGDIEEEKTIRVTVDGELHVSQTLSFP